MQLTTWSKIGFNPTLTLVMGHALSEETTHHSTVQTFLWQFDTADWNKYHLSHSWHTVKSPPMGRGLYTFQTRSKSHIFSLRMELPFRLNLNFSECNSEWLLWIAFDVSYGFTVFLSSLQSLDIFQRFLGKPDVYRH